MWKATAGWSGLHAYFWNFVGLIPDHFNKASCNLFAAGWFCHQFIKHLTSVKCNKVKSNKRRYAYIFLFPGSVRLWQYPRTRCTGVVQNDFFSLPTLEARRDFSLILTVGNWSSSCRKIHKIMLPPWSGLLEILSLRVVNAEPPAICIQFRFPCLSTGSF